MAFLSLFKNKTFQAIAGGLLILALALPIALSFRLYPLKHYKSGDAEEKATVFVLSQIRKKIQEDVNANYPQLIPEAKALIRKQLFDKFLRQEKDNVRHSIETLAQNLSSSRISPQNQDYPYLLASDSFYYYELTENLINSGQLGTDVKGSKYFNNKMLAPNGHWVPLTLHPYVGLGLYKILCLFDPKTPLMYAVSFTPLVITTLSIVLFVTLCRLLGANFISSLVGTFFFALSQSFVKRSAFGWYDNDPYNIFFPLLLLLCLFIGIKSLWSSFGPNASLNSSGKDNLNKKRAIRRAVISGFFSSFVLWIYSLFWQGWVLLFGIFGLSGLAVCCLNYFWLREKKYSLPFLAFWGTFLFGSFLLISLAFGVQDFFTLFAEGWTALQNFLTPQLSLWPDIYISVGELHAISWSNLINQTGGYFLFAITCLGLGGACFRFFKRPWSEKTFDNLILVFFFLAATFIALGAQRFALLCVIPWSLLFVLGMDDLFRLSKLAWVKVFPTHKRTRKVCHLLTAILLLASMVLPIRQIKKVMPTLLDPIYNNVWDKVLSDIREKTPENSIINSWWSPGYFIRAMAKRKVTFDGGTINFPQAYWMANVFLTSSEKEAAGLLRMLNNSGNRAAEWLQQQGRPLSESVDLLKKIVKTDDLSARIFLGQVLQDNEKTNALAELTHATPPPSYLLLYKEFVEKNLQLAYIGRWNFRAVELINSHPDILKKVPPRHSTDYIDFLWSLSGGQLKYSGPLAQISQKDNILLFPDNIRINLSTKACTINSKKYGQGVPYSLFYASDSDVKEKKFNEGHVLPYSVLLLQEGKNHALILLDTDLARSLLVRLFYFKGKGLKYFRPFIAQSDLTGRTEIQVYEVDWKRFEEDLRQEQINP